MTLAKLIADKIEAQIKNDAVNYIEPAVFQDILDEQQYFQIFSESQGTFAILRIAESIEETKKALMSAIQDEFAGCENISFELEKIEDNTEILMHYTVDNDKYTDLISLFKTFVY